MDLFEEALNEENSWFQEESAEYRDHGAGCPCCDPVSWEDAGYVQSSPEGVFVDVSGDQGGGESAWNHDLYGETAGDQVAAGGPVDPGSFAPRGDGAGDRFMVGGPTEWSEGFGEELAGERYGDLSPEEQNAEVNETFL